MSATSEATAEMSPHVLRAQEITFSYGSQPVLFGVSLSVCSGEALALLGTNGAGKSTLLRVLAGLSRPASGYVFLGEQDVTGLPAEDLVRLGFLLVTGGRAVFADMTVAENLEMQALIVRRRKTWWRERRAVVLDTFPSLARRLGQLAGHLSGGEQQQLALAKALLLEPRVLCIDELSLGLAPIVVQGLLEIVRRIQATGVAVILVEQSLNIAAELCDRAIFMEKGEVRFEGPTNELLTNSEIARAVFLGSHTATRSSA